MLDSHSGTQILMQQSKISCMTALFFSVWRQESPSVMLRDNWDAEGKQGGEVVLP